MTAIHCLRAYPPLATAAQDSLHVFSLASRRGLVGAAIVSALLSTGSVVAQPQAQPPAAHESAPKAVDMKRYKALSKIIDRNVGHAHFTRGMNRNTLLALGQAVTVADIHVLAAMMNDKDRVVAMTAMNVLPTLGPEAVLAFKNATTYFNSYDLNEALGNAEDLRRWIEESKRKQQ